MAAAAAAEAAQEGGCPSQPAVPPQPQFLGVGIIGGISYVSTVDYYQAINARAISRFSGVPQASLLALSTPRVAVASVNLADYARMLHQGDLAGVRKLLAEAAMALSRTGMCQFLCIASNTGHLAYEAIAAANGVPPVLHIADCVAARARALLDKASPCRSGSTADSQIQASRPRLGFIGTQFTMEEPGIARDRLELHGFQVIVPGAAADRARLQRLIESELSLGQLDSEASRRWVLQELVLQGLVREQGVFAVVLGCTEIPLLFKAPSPGGKQPGDVDDEGMVELSGGICLRGRWESGAVWAWMAGDQESSGVWLLSSADLHIEAAIDVAAGRAQLEDFLPAPLNSPPVAPEVDCADECDPPLLHP